MSGSEPSKSRKRQLRRGADVKPASGCELIDSAAKPVGSAEHPVGAEDHEHVEAVDRSGVSDECPRIARGRSQHSGIATELGTMRVTEQIDALYTMAVNPVQYLIVPRVIAGLVMVPILSVLFTLVGMGGCYFVGVVLLNIDPGIFISKVQWFVDPKDLINGLVKACAFGGILTMVGCYKGFYASGGARGVGIATTQSVVLSSVLILIADYFLTAMMFQ